MNENVAQDLQVKENKKLTKKVAESLEQNASEDRQAPVNLAEDACNSDEVIAKILQRQSDEEYVEMCKSTKNNFKGASEISSNYQNTQKQTETESDDEELVEDSDEERFWDRLDKLEKQFNIMPTCGLRLAQDGTTITKHGITMSCRKNACKINLPPYFHTDDRTLLVSQMQENKFKRLARFEPMEKLTERFRRLSKGEFDISEHTRTLLHKMICNRLLETVNGVTNLGKEAVILHAHIDISNAKNNTFPKECAIKVFRYIRDGKKIERSIIARAVRRLARKEMRNLRRLKRVGIPCPEVIALNEHILVMGFIGRDGNPAPQIKYAEMNKNRYTAAYNQVVKCVDIMYNKAGLIHADLSEHNILWYNDKCYFIDVTKSMEPEETSAFEFLIKDCQWISKNKCLEDVKTAEELFFDITGFDYLDKLALSAMEKKVKMKLHCIDRAGFEDVSGKSRIGVLTKTEHAKVEEPVGPPIDPLTT